VAGNTSFLTAIPTTNEYPISISPAFLQVFSALGKSALHVPFRNSKLTQVLQPSLSGDAKVWVPF